jgi:hypothetical protein
MAKPSALSPAARAAKPPLSAIAALIAAFRKVLLRISAP